MTLSRVLITGTGRSGTATAATVLSDAGFEVGHQRIKHQHVLDGVWPDDVAVDGDSSFEAAPIAADLREAGWRIVLLIRDPAMVVRSWLMQGAFTSEMSETHALWFESIVTYCPDVLESASNRWAMAMRYYIDWNEMILPAAHTIERLESLTRSRLLQACHMSSRRGEQVAPMPCTDLGTPDRHAVRMNPDRADLIRRQVAALLPQVFDYRKTP